MKAFKIIVLILGAVLSLSAKAKPHERLKIAPRTINIKLSSLKMGQFGYGRKEVEIKLNHFLQDFGVTLPEFLKLRQQDVANEKVQDILRSIEFDRFLSRRNIQIVRDPEGSFRIFDGHHLFLTLQLLEIENVEVVMHEDFWVPGTKIGTQVLKKRMADFEDYMVENNLVRLVSNHGRTMALEDLPSELQNDPFRSLAWILKQAGVFKDIDEAYQEFAWSGFLEKNFRKNGWNVEFETDEEFMVAAKRALKILYAADRDDLRKLPGYLKLPKKAKDIRHETKKVLDRCDRLLSKFSID